MKTHWFATLVVGAAGCALLVWKTASMSAPAGAVAAPSPVVRPPAVMQPVAPSGYEEVTRKLEAALNEARHFSEGEAVPVYKVTPVDASRVRGEAAGLANQVLAQAGGGKPFSAAELRAEDDYLTARNDKGIKLQAYARSGFVSVMNQDQVFHGRCAALSDSQAADLARKFVTANKLVRLLPNEKLTVAEVKHVRSRAVPVKGGQPGEPVLNSTVAILGRELDGKPVIGPGGRVVVFLSGAGQVVGLQRNWREIEAAPAEKVTAIGPAQAAKRVAAELASRYGRTPPAAQTLRVVRAESGYFAAAKHQAQGFLQPAYAMHLLVGDGKGAEAAEVIVVSGAQRTLEPLVPTPAEAKGMKRPAALPRPTGSPDD